jgi:hypothetical protein
LCCVLLWSSLFSQWAWLQLFGLSQHSRLSLSPEQTAHDVRFRSKAYKTPCHPDVQFTPKSKRTYRRRSAVAWLMAINGSGSNRLIPKRSIFFERRCAEADRDRVHCTKHGGKSATQSGRCCAPFRSRCESQAERQGIKTEELSRLVDVATVTDQQISKRDRNQTADTVRAFCAPS